LNIATGVVKSSEVLKIFLPVFTTICPYVTKIARVQKIRFIGSGTL
jgi:hypothetical protein